MNLILLNKYKKPPRAMPPRRACVYALFYVNSIRRNQKEKCKLSKPRGCARVVEGRQRNEIELYVTIKVNYRDCAPRSRSFMFVVKFTDAVSTKICTSGHCHYSHSRCETFLLEFHIRIKSKSESLRN